MANNKPVTVLPTSKSSQHVSPRAWSKPSTLFKDRRRQQTGGINVPQTGLIQDIQTLRLTDITTVRLFHAAEKAGYYNDDNMLLERLVQLLHKLPRHSRKGKLLTDAFITKLWSTLDHPQPRPIPSLMGHGHRHRTADGSNSNPYLATLGAAGTAYARAVTPMDVQSPDMPDAGLVFDTLMARNQERPHPCGLSSMMFYLGVIITHDIFQTDSKDGGINQASSYLDLAPLYGNNLEEQTAMRQFKGGLLKPDCFSHKRILTFPPACCVFLLMFNRFHNYVVTQLASINEANRFKKPTESPISADPHARQAWKQYDEDLFQTGRLITCGLYVNIILKDYVRAILCLNRTDSTWTIDPRTNMDRHAQKDTAPTGVGNQVSVEFNLLYRWHSIISKRDAEWTAQEMRRLLGGKDPETASFHEMITGFREWEDSLSSDPQERPSVPGLDRDATGSFPDDELVDILKGGIEDTAGSFGANSVPSCLRPVEMLGIMQARRWRVGTLNEFRAFIGLTRHRTFTDINPDPSVAAKLEALYGSPANVELYPGLVCEKTKAPMAPGSGVCVGFTASRAILSDAVALVRGDRFYTNDFTPKNLTNWGFSEVDSDLDVDSGNVMFKLIFCAFPNYFQSDSIYAHHPLVTPSENSIIFEGLKKKHHYSWDPPTHQEVFVNCPEEANGKKEVSPPIAFSGGSWHEVSIFVQSMAERLLAKAYTLPSHLGQHPVAHGIDIISDVISLAFVRLTAEMFSLSLKASNEKRKGGYTDVQLSTILSVLYAAESPKLSPGRSYELKRQAQDLTSGFKRSIQVPEAVKVHSRKTTRRYGQRLWESQRAQGKKGATDRFAMLVACSAMVPTLLVAEALDSHLEQGVEHMMTLRGLAQQETEASGKATRRGILDNKGKKSKAAKKPRPDPLATFPPLTDYFPQGTKPKDLDIYTDAMSTLFRALVVLPGLRRAPGVQGSLKAVPSMVWEGQAGRESSQEVMYMTSDRSSLWPTPTTMNVMWNAEVV